MGPCSVNSVTLPDGKSWSSGVSICSNFQLLLVCFIHYDSGLWNHFFYFDLMMKLLGVRWEMQVSRREQMPWHLHQHMQTTNSGLLMSIHECWICIYLTLLPSPWINYTFHFQTFFKDHMGVDLYMEPNFEDYSCQVNIVSDFVHYFLLSIVNAKRTLHLTFVHAFV